MSDIPSTEEMLQLIEGLNAESVRGPAGRAIVG